MSLLLLDIGNTRLKWASATSGRIEEVGAVEHGGDPAQALDTLGLPVATSVWVANVTGADSATALRSRLQLRFGCEPNFAVSEASRLGLRNAYAEPARLGVDRWLAMLGAWKAVGGALSVVDAGTALTVDRVDADGRHLGGLIAPGLVTMQRAVLGATRFATANATEGVRAYDAGLGGDTLSAVRQGAYLACLGAIERATRDGGACFITGGDAAMLLAQLDGRWQHRPNLVLEGLLALAGERG